MLPPAKFLEGLEKAVKNMPVALNKWATLPEALRESYIEDVQMYFNDANAIMASVSPEMRHKISEGIFQLHKIWYG